MSFAGPVSHLPSPIGGDNFNQILLKTLFYMDFDELNIWIHQVSCGKYYLFRPKFTNIVDQEVCLEQSAHMVLYKAMISPINQMRKNGRDKKLLCALKKNDFSRMASILASSVRSYWQDRKYMIYALSKSYRDQNIVNQ